MTAIEMRVSPMVTDAQTGKGNGSPPNENLSFSALLAQVQQTSMLIGSNENLLSPIPEGSQNVSEDALSLSESADQEIGNLLDSMLQVLAEFVPMISDPGLKANAEVTEENLSSLIGAQTQNNGWTKEALQSFLSQFKSLIRNIEGSGQGLPQEIVQNIGQLEDLFRTSPQMALLPNYKKLEILTNQLSKDVLVPNQSAAQETGEGIEDLFNVKQFSKQAENNLQGGRDIPVNPRLANVMNVVPTQFVKLPDQPAISSAEISLEGADTDRQDGNQPLATVPLTTAGVLRMSQIQPVAAQEMIHKENFVQDTTQFLISKMKISHLAGGAEARVTLYPEHLGQLDIRISIQQGQMIAQFITDTMIGKDLVESQLASLRASLQHQGIQIEKIEVYQSGDSSLMSQQDHPHERSGENKQHQQSRPNADLQIDEESGDVTSGFVPYGVDTITDKLDKNIDFTA